MRGQERREGVPLSVLPIFFSSPQSGRTLEPALNIMKQPSNSQNGCGNMLSSTQDTEPHSGRAKPEPHPIQIPFSNPIAITAQIGANTSSRVLWLLTSLAPSTAALQLTWLACLSKLASDTHTPLHRGISSKIESNTAKNLNRMWTPRNGQPSPFSRKWYRFSKQMVFNLLVRFYLMHVFSHLDARPVTPTFCHCNCMHVLIHMQAV